MKLTTKGRYAVTALVDLALSSTQSFEPVALTSIADHQHISLSYLEQIFLKLRRAELVRSIRGVKGGYLLNKPMDTINVAMIISAVHEEIITRGCSTKKGMGCIHIDKCLTHNLWYKLDSYIDVYLSKITIQDLIHDMKPISYHQDPLRII